MQQVVPRPLAHTLSLQKSPDRPLVHCAPAQAGPTLTCAMYALYRKTSLSTSLSGLDSCGDMGSVTEGLQDSFREYQV